MYRCSILGDSAYLVAWKIFFVLLQDHLNGQEKSGPVIPSPGRHHFGFWTRASPISSNHFFLSQPNWLRLLTVIRAHVKKVSTSVASCMFQTCYCMICKTCYACAFKNVTVEKENNLVLRQPCHFLHNLVLPLHWSCRRPF